MSTTVVDTEAFLDTIRSVADVAARHADDVDREARFPAESMKALGEAGIWGVLSSPEVGGLGLGFGAASRVIRRVPGSPGAGSRL